MHDIYSIYFDSTPSYFGKTRKVLLRRNQLNETTTTHHYNNMNVPTTIKATSDSYQSLISLITLEDNVSKEFVVQDRFHNASFQLSSSSNTKDQNQKQNKMNLFHSMMPLAKPERQVSRGHQTSNKKCHQNDSFNSMALNAKPNSVLARELLFGYNQSPLSNPSAGSIVSSSPTQPKRKVSNDNFTLRMPTRKVSVNNFQQEDRNRRIHITPKAKGSSSSSSSNRRSSKNVEIISAPPLPSKVFKNIAPPTLPTRQISVDSTIHSTSRF